MVPGSTLRYGSNFIMLTLIPRASSRQPMEAAARPLPSEDTTPPVTKMYFADMSATSLFVFEVCAGWARLSIAGSGDGSNGLTLERHRASYFLEGSASVWSIIQLSP